jgi:dihydropteroate synthase
MGRTTIFPQDRVTIVGVLNLTPDSFSDGGRYVVAPEDAPDLGRVARDAEAMVAAGADVLDLGGESTRPGARPVPAALEIRRTAPAIEALAKRLAVPLSIDTRKADVARAALDAGAVLVNDVSGLRHDPELGAVVARRGAGLILGHLRGEPETMQADVRFDDVVAEVGDELRASVERALAAGVEVERIAADPGIGFGKRLPQNLALLANVGRIRERVGVPILVGPSRKSFLGELTGDPPEARDLATHAACAVAIFAGADAVRVHDVAGARRAAAIALALRQARADASP